MKIVVIGCGKVGTALYLSLGRRAYNNAYRHNRSALDKTTVIMM
jgi:Trk K+ transport system NAD-binding subunit